MATFEAADRGPRGMSVGTLVISMVGIASILAMVSYRYHLSMVIYGPFIGEQVLASPGFQAILTKALGHPMALDGETIERQGTPYRPRYGLVGPPPG